MVRDLVVLVQAPFDLVQVLLDLVQAHLPHGGLISVVSSQARSSVQVQVQVQTRDKNHILKIVLIAAQVRVLFHLPGIWGEGENYDRGASWVWEQKFLQTRNLLQRRL